MVYSNTMLKSNRYLNTNELGTGHVLLQDKYSVGCLIGEYLEAAGILEYGLVCNKEDEYRPFLGFIHMYRELP